MAILVLPIQRCPDVVAWLCRLPTVMLRGRFPKITSNERTGRVKEKCSPQRMLFRAGAVLKNAGAILSRRFQEAYLLFQKHGKIFIFVQTVFFA